MTERDTPPFQLPRDGMTMTQEHVHDADHSKSKSGGRPKETEVYGFVAWMVSFVVFAIFLLWAFLPDNVLRSAGIFYFPNKYWALALPVWLCVSVVFMVLFYVGINMVTRAPPNSMSTITDEYSVKVRRATQEGGIDPVGDIPISVVNKTLYSSSGPVSLSNITQRATFDIDNRG